MTKDYMMELLKRGESTSLDWKREFPHGMLKGRSDPYWDQGRAEVLKDIIAIANAEENGSGYLVYGIEDTGASRNVVGLSRSWDDATFQTWAENAFDPPPRFTYTEIEWDHGWKIGVFTIERSAVYPHVVKEMLGSVIHKGQVWFRRGSKNSVALRGDLERMFTDEKPFTFTNLDDNDPVFKRVTDYYRERGFEPSLPFLTDKDSKLAQGYTLAYYPDTRREIWVGYNRGHFGHILMLRPRP